MKKVWILCIAGVLAVGLGAAAVQAAAPDTGKNLSHCTTWETNPNCTRDCPGGSAGDCLRNCDGSHGGVCTGGQCYGDGNGDGICDNAGECTGGQNYGNHHGHCGGHHGGQT